MNNALRMLGALGLTLFLLAGCDSDGGTTIDCNASCQKINACFSTMDTSQCVEGCNSVGSSQSAACNACMDMSCGQAFGCCLVNECGTPEDALGGIDCN